MLRRAKRYPTELLTPFMGAMAMRAIYRDARDHAGADFDCKAVLDRMLSCGALPPDLLRAQLAADGFLSPRAADPHPLDREPPVARRAAHAVHVAP